MNLEELQSCFGMSANVTRENDNTLKITKEGGRSVILDVAVLGLSLLDFLEIAEQAGVIE